MKICITTLILSLALVLNAAEKQMSVYHIGNSLTRSITMDRLHFLMEARGVDYQFGSQLSGGASLERHWDYKNKIRKTNNWETNQKSGDIWEPGPADGTSPPKRFGCYDQALSGEYHWDALVLQPHGSHIKLTLPAARNFLNYVIEQETVDQIYIYSTWPHRPRIKGADPKQFEDTDYQKLWTRAYTHTEAEEGKPHWKDSSNESGAYFRMLIETLRREFPQLKKPILMIPVGDMFYELDKRVRAGEIPGLAEIYERSPSLLPGYDPAKGITAGVNMFYVDGIHPNPITHKTGNVGNFAVGCTFTAVYTRQTPVGIPGSIYGLDDKLDASLIKAIQETVWDVVSNHPYTGME